MNKCSGCGAIIESDKILCERCFRIRNYNEYTKVELNNSAYIDILKSIPENELKLLIVDLFDFADLTKINEYLNGEVILVLTKRDILPKSVYEENLLNYDYKVKVSDKIIISSNKNYQLDELVEIIKKHKKVYLIGFTNAGKSTLINKLLYNYFESELRITTSPLPSTTLDILEIKLPNLTFYDTPGIIDLGNITNYVSSKQLKKITPNKELKPITYQIKSEQSIIIDEFAIIKTNNTNITLFMSNSLNIKRVYREVTTDLVKHEIEAKNGFDIVIQGLGFIKVSKTSKFIIYTLDKVSVYTRKSLI